MRPRQAARDGRCGGRVVGLAGAAVRESGRGAPGCGVATWMWVAGVKFGLARKGWWRPSLVGGWRRQSGARASVATSASPRTLTKFWSRQQGREGRCALRHSGQLWNCSAAQNWSLGCAGFRERKLLCSWGTAVRHRQAARDGRNVAAAWRISQERPSGNRGAARLPRPAGVATWPAHHWREVPDLPGGWWRPSLVGGWREPVRRRRVSATSASPHPNEFWSRRCGFRVGRCALRLQRPIMGRSLATSSLLNRRAPVAAVCT